MKIVECVPNFSEGRDRSVIDRIAAAISGVEGVELLDVEPGAATHRTVMTFVGTPEAALEGAFAAIRAAAELIDMRKHKGEHARMGATDVCPFVPVAGVGMDECVELAQRLGQRVGDELAIPVYLYEAAASRPERRNLADIRAGEYEGLAAKLADPEWVPDYGPAELDAGCRKTGATVIGARKFLIAYNVNLNTRDRRLATDIALDVREAGRLRRDDEGAPVRGADGKFERVPGRLPATKAVGWFIEEYDRAQVSINLVDHEQTAPHQAFDAIEEEATKRGLRVTGSELIGLIPLDAMLAAGRHYLERQGRSLGIPERRVVETAVQSLGLRELGGFDANEKIIEYRLARDKRGLVDLSLEDFAAELSTDSPAPGGGSVAALSGALAAALAAMVGNLTHGRKGQEDVWDEMTRLAEEAQELKDWFLAAVDRDTEAFNQVMAAMRGKAKSKQEKAAKAERMRLAGRGATQVPLEVLDRCGPALDLARRMAEEGNPNSLSDAGVAGWCARAAAEGAYYNVLINLASLEGDEEWASEVRDKATETLEGVRDSARKVARSVEKKLAGGAGRP